MGRRRRLLLTYDVAAVPEGGAAVFAKLTGLTYSYGKDPAGHIYHVQALRQSGLYEEEASEDDQNSEVESSSIGPSRENSAADFSSLTGAQAEGEDAKWKGRGRKRKSKKREGIDLYALLGLQMERWMATEMDIKAAYRRAALEHHPDKQRAAAAGDEEVMQASEDRFKAIQEAYETLCDANKRREYDSLDPFDDSLPGEEKAATPESYFTHFGTAFRRNSKWSVNQPVPEFGDDDTDMDHVDAFYEFWFSFKSWREFPHPDEEDIETAECREERRWIERHNAKLREKGKKEEFRRVRDFVELSYKLDPRLQRRKEAQRAERERQRAQREAEKAQKAEEERLRAEEEEREKAAEAEAAAAARKKRQMEKKALQKERARLRKICAAECGGGICVDEDDVELLCANLNLSTIGALCDQLSATHLSGEEKESVIETHIRSLLSKEDEEKRQKKAAAAAVAAAAALAAKEEAEVRKARLKEWDEEEVRLLRKALEKFPPGTSKRWDTVQAYVRTRTVDEILDMVKYGLKTGKYTAPTAAGPVIAKKKQANTVIHSEATLREQSFSDLDIKPSGKAAEVLSAGSTVPEVDAPSTTQWTKEEEVILVSALKKVPKDAADRWDQVAAAVGTQNKAECARRFKDMKQSYKAKKVGV